MASPDGRNAILETYQHAPTPAQISMLPLMLQAGITDPIMLPTIAQAITSVQGDSVIGALASHIKQFDKEAEILVAPLLEATKTCDPERCHVVSLFAYDPVQHSVVAAAPDVGECASESTPPTVWNGKTLRFETRAQPSDSAACTEKRRIPEKTVNIIIQGCLGATESHCSRAHGSIKKCTCAFVVIIIRYNRSIEDNA